ncbi:MAG TPA: SDR family oxidoreductase, partial [bacterium]|nr:SDR family oxidoreductase [bacterium]
MTVTDPGVKLLITGASGLLGNNLACYFRDKYDILGLYNNHPVTIKGIQTECCDISNSDSIQKVFREFDPSIIIHCASSTKVDECEKNKDSTKKNNVQATKNLIESIDNKNTKLIYISTDSVYDGGKGNFSEVDNANPLNYYGQTKFEGELEAAKKDNSLIFRTNIFGWNVQDKKSLGEWILGELESGRNIPGFRDAYFSPIYTCLLYTS